MIFIINGPNLNLLGFREPALYGDSTLDDIHLLCSQYATLKGYSLNFMQSNYEGEIIEWLHQACLDAQGVIINAAGFTHTSVSIGDAIKMLLIPTIELHITNPHQREPFRHVSYLSAHVTATIAGFGTKGYTLALEGLIDLIERQKHNG